MDAGVTTGSGLPAVLGGLAANQPFLDEFVPNAG